MKKYVNKKMIILVIFLSLILVTVGVSYSFFNYVKEGSSESSIKLGNITFKYTENSGLGNGINITDSFPISDSEGKIQTGEGKVFDFKVEANLSRSDMEYEITVEPTKNSNLPLDAIKFYLVELDGENEIEIDSMFENNGTVKTLDDFSDTTIINQSGKTVYQETILKNTKDYIKKFRARLWINEDIDWADDKYVNKSGQFRINVYANSDRTTASTDTTTPSDVRVERVTANNKYLFNKIENETYQYELTVPNEVSSIDISAIPINMSATSTITDINGGNDFSLKSGSNYFKLLVTSSDNSKQKEYILKIEREKSNNTNLNSLSVGEYELTPSYSNNENIYNVEVEYEITSISVIAEKGELEQTITGNKDYQLEVGSNQIEVIVTAENGTTRTINITVNRKKSNDASISNVNVKGYSLTHLENNIYYVEVPYNVDSIEIENISETDATVNGGGIKENLVVDNNDFEVEVISQNGLNSNTYIIRVIRGKDTTNTLNELSLTNCTLSPTFNSNTIDYTCTVANTVTKTTVTANSTSTVATITGLGEKILTVGNNTIEVKVTSQSGSINTYTVVVNRLPNSDATLKSLVVSSGTLSPTFNSNTTSYTVEVPYSVDNITISGATSQTTSNVEGLGAKTLIVGENTFNIEVTAEDTTTVKTYTIKVTRKQDTDTSLKSLEVENYEIVKTDNNHYTLTVANNVTSVNVKATATSSVAIITGTGAKTLTVGENIVKVIVTAQNGDIKTYEIKITRLASSDATLKSLVVSSGTLSPTFSANTTVYTLSVPYSVTSLTVTPTVNNSEATYTVSGNNNFIVGENTVTIKVTAGDKTEKTYTIKVTRQQDTINTLSSLSLTNCTLSPTFNSNTTSYTCTVANTVTKTTVTANATSSVATIEGLGDKTLSVGTNTVKVKVTSQSGSIKTYTVIVTRKASSDATLKSLAVSSGTLSPTFSANTTAYTLSVPYNTTSLTVTPTVNNSEATYTVSGNSNFVVGENTVTIKVTAGDKTEKTYTITVTRLKDTDNTLKSLEVSGYSLTPTFTSNTTSYTLTLEASSITVSAEANSNVALVSGTGSKNLNWGSNDINIIVTSQSGSVKTYKITVNNQRPTAPTLTGGSDSWVSTAKTISVETAGSAISGVKHYEYYKSTSNTQPTDSTTATGTTSNSITISDEGTTYVWFRTVSNNNFKSSWTSTPQVVKRQIAASNLQYNNSTTGFDCDDVQCAIDELDNILSK